MNSGTSISTCKSTPRIITKREMKIKNLKRFSPHPIFGKDDTIKWFRNRYPETLLKKSVHTILPNNGAQMLKDEPTQMNIIKQWLETYCKPEDKFKNYWINPKYFYSEDLFNKIVKLKNLFLEFDEDGSRKMEIDEMVTMFKTNKINVTEDELCSLFFKGKKYRKQDINKLYLDFYQFMQFAIDEKHHKKFHLFMRKVKERIAKNKEIEKEKKREEEMLIPEEMRMVEECSNENNMSSDKLLVDDEKNDPVFLPMNINLVLDYFLNKGKERQSQKIIRKAIKQMKNILSPGSFPPDDPDIKTEEDEGSKMNEYDKQMKDINTKQILEEFSKLFEINYTLDPEVQAVKEQQKKKKSVFESGVLRVNRNRSIPYKTQRQPSSLNSNNSQYHNDILKEKPKKSKKLLFTEMIRKKLNTESVTDIHLKFYQRYRSVHLAQQETSRYFSKDKDETYHPYNQYRSRSHLNNIKSQELPCISPVTNKFNNT